MTVVLTRNLVLTDNLVSANAPIIGYHNMVTEVNVAASEGSDAQFPVSRLANDATNLFWKSANNDLQYIEVSSIDEEIDYIAWAYHNFGTGRFRFWVEASFDGGANYFALTSDARKRDNGPVMITFTRQFLTNVRIYIDPEGRDVPYMSVLFVGQALKLPRNIYVGYAPIMYARQSKTNNARSESGHFLGRLVTGRSSQSGFTLSNLDPYWVRESLVPFMDYAEDRAFFFAWRPRRYPFEIGYCWLIDDPIPKNDLPNGMMAVTLNMGGLVI